MSDTALPSTWTTAKQFGEQILEKLAAETGARLDRDAADRLVLVHDLKQP